MGSAFANALQKLFRVETCSRLLALYAANPDHVCDVLCQIVTSDETWIHHWDPDIKQESMQWKHVDYPPPKKFCTQPLTGKIMATMGLQRRSAGGLPSAEDNRVRNILWKSAEKSVRWSRKHEEECWLVVHCSCMTMHQCTCLVLHIGEQWRTLDFTICHIHLTHQTWHPATSTYLTILTVSWARREQSWWIHIGG